MDEFNNKWSYLPYRWYIEVMIGSGFRETYSTNIYQHTATLGHSCDSVMLKTKLFYSELLLINAVGKVNK